MNITEEILEEYATPKSFARGWVLYEEGAVESMEEINGEYHGIVWGSQQYSVILDHREHELLAHCDCPYSDNYEGICKHLVAAGLYLIHTETYAPHNTLPESASTVRAINRKPSSKKESKHKQSQIDTHTRLAFLDHLISENPTLEKALIDFAQGPSLFSIAPQKDGHRLMIQALTREFKSFLANKTFRTKKFHNVADYRTKNLLDAPLSHAKKLITEGTTNKGIEELLKVYRACVELESTLNIGTKHQRTNFIRENIHYVGRHITQASKEIEIRPDSENAKKLINTVLNAIDEFSDSYMLYWCWVDLWHLLKGFTETKAGATNLWEALKAFSWHTDDVTAPIRLLIADQLNDNELFKQTVLPHGPQSPAHCLKLLAILAQENNQEAFVKVAKNGVYNRWESVIEYLKNHLDPSWDSELTREVYLRKMLDENSLKPYLKVREHLTEKYRMFFYSVLLDNERWQLCAQFLKTEKRYTDLLKLAQESKPEHHPWTWIHPILEKYPEACFEILENACCQLFDSRKRTGKTYAKITACLQTMTRIPSKKREVQDMIQVFYEHRPKLPSLRAALEDALLVRKEDQPQGQQNKTPWWANPPEEH